MGQRYSFDLRSRIVAHGRAGHSRREAARHFGVSASCAVKLLKRMQGSEVRLTDLDGGGCGWRLWMCSEGLNPQRLCDSAPKCVCSVQEPLLGVRWGGS